MKELLCRLWKHKVALAACSIELMGLLLLLANQVLLAGLYAVTGLALGLVWALLLSEEW